MAEYRQTVSAGGISEDSDGDWGGVWMALKDPFTYFFSAIHFFLIIAQSFKDFFPSVKTFPLPSIYHLLTRYFRS